MSPNYRIKALHSTLFLVVIGILPIHSLFSQCTNGSQPECACETAPVLCTIDELDGYTFSMTSFQHPGDGPSPICPGANQSQTNNPTWFAFTAWCTNLTLRVSAENCVAVQNFVGFQLAIYEDCTFTNAVACNANIDDCNTDDKILNITGLNIGDVYYFYVDGCLGSYCDVIIDVIGVCGQEEIVPWTSPVSGDANPCVGNAVTYQVDDLDGAGAYHWFVDGDLVELTPDNSVDLQWAAAGTYQLCIDASNDPCVPLTNDPLPLCTTITVHEADAGSLNAAPAILCLNESTLLTATGFISGPDNAQVFLITDATGTIIEVINSESGTFSTSVPGVYTVYSYNYVPAISAIPTIGISIQSIDCAASCCDLESLNIIVQQITATFNSVECSDNGTGDDPSDDVFFFSLFVSGTGASWTATDETIAGVYGQLQICGPYSIAAGNLNLVLEDNDVEGCVTSIVVPPPMPCSACSQSVDAGPGFTLNCYAATTVLLGSASNGGNYEWSGPGTFSDTGLMATVVDSGWYYLTAVFPNQCAFTDSAFVNMDQEYPLANAGVDQSFNCHGNSVLLDGSASIGENLVFEWQDQSGLTISYSPFHLINQPGIYTLTATNVVNGCEATDVAAVFPDSNVLSLLTASIFPENCVDENNGEIFIQEVSGGTAPYSYTLNETITNNSGSFFDLAPGVYDIHISDFNGCSLDTFFTIEEGVDLEINLPTIIDVTEGQTGQINVLVNVPGTTLNSIQWIPPGFMACDTCLHTTLMPEANQQFQLTVMHVNGCIATADLQINVIPKPQIYIPNAFSPNGDGVNDVFTLYANDGVDKIVVFDVFDRWGDHIFHRQNLNPNDPLFGWDGRFQEKEMHSAAFVYFFELLMRDGTSQVYKGDITIVR